MGWSDLRRNICLFPAYMAAGRCLCLPIHLPLMSAAPSWLRLGSGWKLRVVRRG